MTEKSNLPAIGKLVDAGAERDAIHVAILPVIAGEKLNPGQHVGVLSSEYVNGKLVKATVRSDYSWIGIIDPFLPFPVFAGQRCYLFLYPNTVTSLRHEWEHPAFDEGGPDGN